MWCFRQKIITEDFWGGETYLEMRVEWSLLRKDLSWFGDQNPDRTGPSQCWPGVGVVCQSCHRRPEFLPHWLFLFFHWLTPLTWAVWLPFWLLSDLQNTGAAQDDGRLSWPIVGRMAGWTSIPILLPLPWVEANSKPDCQGLLCSKPEEAVYQEVSQDGSCSLCFFVGQLFPEQGLCCLFPWSRFFIVIFL